MIGIRHISSYLPERVLKNADLESRFEFKPGFLDRKVGVFERRIAGSEESTSDLCVKAGECLFAETDLEPGAVEMAIVCTQNGDYRLPHTSAIVQHRLGLPTRVAAFDINLGCSGYIYSLATIEAWMRAHGTRHSLLFTCDPYSKIIHPEDRSTLPIFGDAATVSWISAASDNALRGAVFGTDGAHFEALIVRQSGTRVGQEPSGHYGFLEMDGRVLYEYMLRRIPETVHECLEGSELAPSDVDYYLFHPGSRHLLEGIRKALEIPSEKMVCNYEYLGNTVSSTVPLALAEVMAREPMAGKRVLLCGYGVGLSWAACVLQFGAA